ncbi:transcription termination/antitermination NusG family protein [Candidatus Thioglobus sp.]|jgi:Transcription antiterminator|uniref:transcription termination/antitermination NusG family protein n=1 Tax=Candidatus Thioglobus sp. TaxID=2026721 RepID=UPI0032420298
MKNYYLIQSKPRQEDIATQNLENQGYHVFHPKASIKGKIVSLFPRYLFVKLDNKSQNWSPIRSTTGVLNFVRFGLEFAKVPDQIVNLIKDQQQQTTDKIIDLSKFHKNDKVEILSGPFKGQKAIFSSYNADERVIVLLKILNNQQKLAFDSKQLVAI